MIVLKSRLEYFVPVIRGTISVDQITKLVDEVETQIFNREDKRKFPVIS